MDSVVIGLSVAVAIVIVLLLSCKNKKTTHKGSHASNKKRVTVRAPKRGKSYEHSEYGTGLDNTASNNRYQDLAGLASYEDYNAVAAYMSVEPEVYESHARYSDDLGRSTSGASMLPVRDDPNDVVPWVGLRKPKYQDAFVTDGARQEHSEIPDQMRGNSYYCVG